MIYTNLIQNLLNHSVTPVKGLTGYTQKDVSLTDLQTKKYRINELTESEDPYAVNYLTHGTSDAIQKLICLNLTEQQER